MNCWNCVEILQNKLLHLLKKDYNYYKGLFRTSFFEMASKNTGIIGGTDSCNDNPAPFPKVLFEKPNENQ